MRSIRLALLTLVVLACSDSTRPPPPAQIAITPGQLRFAALAETKILTATVRDANGGEIGGAAVTWTGSPVVSVTPLQDTLNKVRIAATAAGRGTVTASVGGISQTIDIEVVQTPARVDMSLPITDAPAGTTVPAPVQIRVLDPLGSPVPNIAVELVPVGGGSVSPAHVVTESNGAALAQWTLGTTAGEQRLLGRVGPSSDAVFVTATAGSPAALLKLAGDAQGAWTDAPVDIAPAVRVIDQFGNGVAGVNVAFTPSAGTVAWPSRLTGADGSASVERWILGPTPGPMTLTVSVAALPPATFTVDAATGEPLVSIVPVAGDQQLGTEGTRLDVAPSIQLVDTLGAPQANRQVTFHVATGDGSLSVGTATTTPEGIATVDWTLGPVAGPNELTVRVADGPAVNNGVKFRATGCTGGGGAFVINVCFATPMTVSQRLAFVDAAARWSSIIIGDIADIEVSLPSPACGPAVTPIASRIDDLVIFAAVEPIDGPSQILGSAGWCYARAGGLPLLGAMRFDIADVQMMEAAGRFDDVIMHEIGHVLGIGTLWSRSGFLQNPSSASQPGLDTHFSGVHAVAGFNQIGGAAYTQGAKVPVENTMGPGSINSHWRESVLGNELMTPTINAGVNPLTVLSILSLRDLGYEVDPASADPRVLSDILADRRAAPAFELIDDVQPGPRYTIDREGRVRRLR